MANKFYTIFTEIGKASVANAIATQTKITFDKVILGDSSGEYYEPKETQTELKNKVWEGKVSSITIDEENPNWIILETAIPGNVGGFMIREAGVLDVKGQLLVVAKYPKTYKPKAEDGSIKDILIKLIIEVSNTECVELKINPTVVLATKKDINNKLDKDERLRKPSDIYSKKEVDEKLKKTIDTSFTGSKILEKLKKVDGDGSGLDADTVDGKHARDLALVDHMHKISDIESLQKILDELKFAATPITYNKAGRIAKEFKLKRSSKDGENLVTMESNPYYDGQIINLLNVEKPSRISRLRIRRIDNFSTYIRSKNIAVYSEIAELYVYVDGKLTVFENLYGMDHDSYTPNKSYSVQSIASLEAKKSLRVDAKIKHKREGRLSEGYYLVDRFEVSLYLDYVYAE